MKKIFLSFILLFTLFFTGCTFNYDAENLTIHFLDVGQGDAILIITPDKTKILIDGGPDNSILNQLGQVMPFWDRQIDIMILTHPHADHVVGLVEVVRRYQIKEVYGTGVIHTTGDYLAWLNEIKSQKIPFHPVINPFTINLDHEITLDFLYPFTDLSNQKVEELNNSSIINMLTYGQTKFLFMGDAEIPVEEELLSSNINLTANVIKIGHHGSKSSSSENFLTAVNPQYAILSVGTDNSFNHPHLITIRRLEKLGIKILRTDINKTITLKSNGQSVFTNQ